MSHQRK